MLPVVRIGRPERTRGPVDDNLREASGGRIVRVESGEWRVALPTLHSPLSPHVPLERALPDLGAVDDTVRIHRDALGRAGAARCRFGVGDERRDAAVAHVADADAALPFGTVRRDGARL